MRYVNHRRTPRFIQAVYFIPSSFICPPWSSGHNCSFSPRQPKHFLILLNLSAFRRLVIMKWWSLSSRSEFHLSHLPLFPLICCSHTECLLDAYWDCAPIIKYPACLKSTLSIKGHLADFFAYKYYSNTDEERCLSFTFYILLSSPVTCSKGRAEESKDFNPNYSTFPLSTKA